MFVVLVILAILAGIGGLLYLSQATQGVGLIGLACFLGILARLAQAERHTTHIHEHLIAIQDRLPDVPPRRSMSHPLQPSTEGDPARVPSSGDDKAAG